MNARRTLAVLVALVSLAATLLVQSQPAGAAVLNVTRRDDPNPNGFTNSDGSLREAIIRANNQAGPDTIVLGNGRYSLRIPGVGENNSQEGDLDIKQRVTIQGNGPGKTIIDANDFERVFEIRPAAERVVLKGLTITGGEVDATQDINPLVPDGGGGILNLGEVRLQNVLVIENASPECCGGGIYNTGKMNIVNSRIARNTAYGCCGAGILNVDGRLRIRNSRIDHNRAHDCCGSAIFNSDAGRTNISDSKIDHNQSPGCCGALYNEDPDSFIKVVRSRLTDNNADACCGGALYQVGDAESVFVRTRLDLNTADNCCGGAIYSSGPDTKLTLRRSRLDNNNSRQCCGGAIYGGSGKLRIFHTTIAMNTAHRDCCGGGIYGASTDLVMRDSLLRGNRSTGETGGFGGGMYLTGGTAEITGTTIAGNFSSTTGGGIFGSGTLEMSIVNSTISGNTSFGNGAGLDDGTTGVVALTYVTIADNRAREGAGGVASNGTGSFDVLRSIIANNSQDDCEILLTGATGPNLDRDASCFDSGAAIHANPRLLDLKNNGGPTPTHALRANSPAVDPPGALACPVPARDQRGVKRPKNGDGQGAAKCDLGAYERKP